MQRVKQALFLFKLKKLAEKRAYGFSDSSSLYERYLNGGHVFGLPHKKVIEDIKRLQREADLNKVRLSFSPSRYHYNPDTDEADEYDSSEAIRQLQAMMARPSNQSETQPDRAPHYFAFNALPKADGSPGKINWSRWKNVEDLPEEKKTLLGSLFSRFR